MPFYIYVMLGSKPCYVREIRHPSPAPRCTTVEILKPVKCYASEVVVKPAPAAAAATLRGSHCQESTETSPQGETVEDEALPDGSCFRRAPLPSDTSEDHYPCRPIDCEGVKVGTLRPASAPNSVPSIAARAAEVSDFHPKATMCCIWFLRYGKLITNGLMELPAPMSPKMIGVSGWIMS
ncbi:hypothetical protein B566_EDAN003078 [Ephemera danica]|nr:hypothetical protein B566_EDAN003078 [Ephemera danica]